MRTTVDISISLTLFALLLNCSAGATRTSSEAGTPLAETAAQDGSAIGPTIGGLETGSSPNETTTANASENGTATGETTSVGTAASWWAPKPTDTWLWDLDSVTVPSPTVSRSPGVTNYSADVYAIDPTNLGAQKIAVLHGQGKKVVCYIDVGSWEPGRTDVANFDSNCICGKNIALAADGTCPSNSHKMSGWKEWWFDLHTSSCAASVAAGIFQRFQNAATLGCDAIEPDNLDAWQNSDAAGAASAGWGITIADQNAYLTKLAQNAHSLGMGILLKNAGGLLVDDNGSATPYADAIVAAFDGSLNEQCHQYSECDTYAGFGAAGKSMWNAEYLNASSTSNCGSTSYKSAYCSNTSMKTLQYSCSAVGYENLAYVCP